MVLCANKNLTKESDWALVKMVREEASDDAFLEVSRRYQDLFYKVCQRYAAALQYSGIFIQDIFNEKNIIILHCIRTFKRNKKTKLSSWIGNYARYLCLNSINARKFIAPSCDTEVQDKIEEVQAHHDFFVNKKDFKESRDYVFDLLGQLKDPRIKEIFEYRYFSDKRMIWKKIARKMNVSLQTTVSLHKRGINLIRNKMQNENFIYDKI